VHAGETGGPEEVRDALEQLDPDRIGHGVRAADDPAVLDMLRERSTVLEVCPSSNLNTRVLASAAEVRRVVRALLDHRVRFTVSTDGPEMLRSYLRDELQMLMRHEILSLDEVKDAIRIGAEASFLDRVPTIDSSVGPRNGAGNGRAALPVGAAT
jgi:adenosine deaminase